MSTSPTTTTAADSEHDTEMKQRNNEDSTAPLVNSNTSGDAATTTTATAAPVATPSSINTTTSSSSFFSLPMSPLNFLLVSGASILLTLSLLAQTRSHPEFLTQNVDLSNGQVMGFLVCFGVIATFVGVHLKSFIATCSPNSSSSSSSSRITEEQYNTLFAATEFVACLLLFFVCDRTKALDRSSKHYSRDTFWFLWLVLVLAGFATLRRAARPAPKPSKPSEAAAADSTGSSATAAVAVPVATSENKDVAIKEDDDGNCHILHLQRDQTEEWKGWMQVMFLWYHYFNATEIYNVIRLYIAAYVWMTGFGNFSYYYIRKDFSLIRFCSMQWRLNFLVFWACLLMQNEYMLYYICMLHTAFTVFIYAGLGVYSSVNQTFAGCVGKFVGLTAAALLIWDVPGVFEYAWLPFLPIVQYTNPMKPQQSVWHEWKFRSHLDHLVWIFGMFCAYNHPTWDAWLKRLDQLPALTGAAIKSAVVAACLLGLKLYYDNVFSLPKKEYNALHPYTSFIPIFLYIVLRNISQIARQYHLHLFEWLGKITLETYISQYHVWMATTGVNGNPKKLLAFLPKEYPLLNFAVASAVCLLVSYRLFTATNALKSYFLPSATQPDALKRLVVSYGASLAAVYMLAALLVFATKASAGSGSA